MKKINLNFMLVILLTVLVNASLIVFTIVQINITDTLQENWDGKATIKVVNAIELAELERNFGYVGFIHHFKNYVIRSNESASAILGYTSDELCKMTVEQLVP